MSKGRLGFALRDALPWPDFTSTVIEGEAAGYSAVFLPETGARDALVTLGALAGETTALGLASGVVPLGSRDLPVMAMAAATVAEASSGRMILGLGTGGLSGAAALDELRESVVALKALLAGETVGWRGRRVKLGMTPSQPPPVWVSALGPKAVELAGAVADGVLLNWCTPERVARAVDEIERGAASTGRSPNDITVAVYARACIDDQTDPADVTRALKKATGQYASYPSYQAQFAAMGMGEWAVSAAAAYEAGAIDDVPDRLVDAVMLGADRDSASARLSDFAEAGADLPVIYPVAAGTDLKRSVRATLAALSPATSKA